VQLGAHIWDLPTSINRYFYASYDFINSRGRVHRRPLTAVSPQQAARANRYNHYGLSAGAMSAATPAAGGGGSGGGGGAPGACWSPESLLRTQRGLVPIASARPMVDYVFTRTGRWRRVRRTFTHEWKGKLHVVPGVGNVTPRHHLARGTEWPAAEELFPETVEYEGTVHNLEVEADSFDEHSYEMATGLSAHNVLEK
jgi:hypothetical protein